MGGRVGDALAIVDWLVDHQVHATIFMTGAMADNLNTDAGRQALVVIDAHPELFRLGNHSYTHRDFRLLTATEIRDELRRTEDPPGPTAGEIVAKVLGNAEGGSIVLMHLGGYETFEALPRIVDGLEAAGYDLVTLDELVGS